MRKKVLFLLAITLGFSFISSGKVKAATSYAQAGIVDTNGSNLNVRASASTSSSIISKLKDDTYVTICSMNNDWYYIEYNEDAYGYVSKSYIDTVEGSTAIVSTNGGRLNVRKGASTSYAVQDSLSDSSEVVILSSSGNWSKVIYDGSSVGYVYNSYLATLAYQPIKLNVTSYKQFDSRWSSYTVGTSSYTMGQIGCAITSLAMVESYRTNTTITPYGMMNKLSFTSGGALFWPSNYTLNSASSNYLSRIYQSLQAGNPVILGCKNSQTSHYIVITGYTGGNTLSTSSFTINDPGSSARTLLSEYLAKYPTFIKTVTL